jgi:peptidyl-prolyl cis-trans isomerase B (cyclophilin B)
MRRICALAGALALALAACGGDGEEEAPVTSGGCEDVEAPEPKAGGGQTPPDGPLEPDEGSDGYELTVETNCGEFVIRLDLDSAPRTAASVVKLAENGFFDDTTFHRIVPGFVIQGGDPTATGTGGPGYTTADPPPPNSRYTKGVVAMAKTGQDPPGTAGSQFFVVTGDDIGLPPEYAIVGRVTEGLDVVERIGRLGNRATEKPTQPVVIRKVLVGQFDEDEEPATEP